MFLLERLQFPDQPVVLGIRNFGGVEDMVEVIVVPDLLAQEFDLGSDVTGGRLQATLILCSNWMISSRM